MVIRLRERVTLNCYRRRRNNPGNAQASGTAEIGSTRWKEALHLVRVSPKEQVLKFAKRTTRNLSGTKTAGELDFARKLRVDRLLYLVPWLSKTNLQES